MSLHADSLNGNQNLSIPAGNASGVQSGAYTVAMLYQRPTTGSPNTTAWQTYSASDFSFREQTIYADDLWVPFAPAQVDSNFPVDSTWRWIVVTKPTSGAVNIRQHWATFSKDAMSWNHVDNTSGPQQDRDPAARFTFGNPFGGLGFAGSISAFVAWNRGLSDAEIENTIHAKASTIYKANPDFMLLMPDNSGASPLVDIVSGATETARTASWTTAADPADFSFKLTDGPVWSYWNGSSEIPLTAKLWNGSAEVDIVTEVAP